MPNRLAAERSPYLLQHKDNPVDWQPWGELAFDQARREDKPIFLSVGYSTCHWCHVMEHESFEDARVADALNRHFVSIKVDREERPDVDRVYMTFVQATTGSGGWPMSVWLTPTLEPFYGGTYFPPTSRWGRPGFLEILEEVARVWRDERDKVERSASTIVERLRTLGARAGAMGPPGADALDVAVDAFAAAFDRRHGGFGSAPKFPRPSELLFLLREHARTCAQPPRQMALAALLAMALGGMRDHIGGGFHRYSVDAEWRVPHFEKMLYDQAQLTLAYVEAAQLTGDLYCADVAADTLAYVRRDLTDPEGGFYSAEDADSAPPEHAHEPAPHKSEGAFYLWRDEELAALLGPDADLFRIRYGVQPEGNAPFDPQGEFTYKNLLFTSRSMDDIAALTGRSVNEVKAALAGARAKLLSVRDQRPRPDRDDKILTAWNGLMIAAFARAGRVLDGGPSYVEDARRAARFIRAQLWRPETETLLRRYRLGEAGVNAYAEDYAYLIFGLLELFQADGDPAWLEWALTLQRCLDDRFWDPAEGGWFSTTGHDASVLLRLKEDYDGAEPAASSVAVLNLLTLSHLVGDGPPDAPGGVGAPHAPPLPEKIERTLGMFAARVSSDARTVPMLLAALSTYHAGTSQIALVGDADDAGTAELMAVVRRRYLPAAVVIPVKRVYKEALARLLPWTAALRMREGKATAYLCRDFACQAPTTSPKELAGQLDRMRTSVIGDL